MKLIKTLFISVITLLVLFIITWFGVAIYSSSLLKEYLATLSENTNGVVSAKYKDVSIEGFPLNVVLTVDNALVEATSPEAVIRYEGDIVITHDLLLKKYSYNIKEDITITKEQDDSPITLSFDNASVDATLSKIFPLYVYQNNEDGVLKTEQLLSVINQISFDSSAIKIHNPVKKKTHAEVGALNFTFGDVSALSHFFNNGGNEPADPMILINIFKDFTFILLNSVFFETTNGNKLLMVDDFTLSSALDRLDSPSADVSIILNTLGVEFTEQGDLYISKFLEATAPKLNGSFISNYHQFGKMNSEIQLNYKGPTSPMAFVMGQDVTASLGFPKINYWDDLSESKNSMAISVVLKDKKPESFTYSLDSKSSFSEEWYELTVANITLQAVDPMGCLGISEEDLEKIKPLFPRMHNYGDVIYDFDVSYQASPDSRVELNSLDFLSDKFGITTKGVVEGQQQGFPMNASGNIDISLLNYKNMIRVLTSFYQNLYEVSDIFLHEQDKLPALKEGFVDAVVSVIDSVAVISENGEDVTISMTKDTQSPFPQIGGQNAMQLMMQAQQALMPFIEVKATPQRTIEENNGDFSDQSDNFPYDDSLPLNEDCSIEAIPSQP